MMHTGEQSKRGGFNAIELVVVVLVVFILIGMVLAALRMQRNYDESHSSTRHYTANNLKQLSMACHLVQDVLKRLPPAFDTFEQMNFPASVHVHLLPYIEQDNLYKRFLEQKENIADQWIKREPRPCLSAHNRIPLSRVIWKGRLTRRLRLAVTSRVRRYAR